eukprot:CAMPEP_0114122046 /NCGR_PEP_ID=MMETSP0043_2-20121206/7490_1 /TAXON_ID=464988 /ORGANISM="Hemiselmis andersenii, Strain CCMP644" /LENGTH=109 /DNA_ID=CAMNT_0001214743 /DNA_START=89 /DNA_END=415 /DNA_ORIENTATION=+
MWEEVVGFSFEATRAPGDGESAAEDAPRPPYTITEVESGTEASSKLRLGDEIVAVDGCPVACLRIRSVRTLLLGPADSTMSMKVRRGGEQVTLSLQRQGDKQSPTRPAS